MRTLPTVCLAAALLATTVRADALLPPDKPMGDAIDHYIDGGLAAAKIVPAPPADEFTLIRRLTLDLVGRIPTPAETQTFLAEKSLAKRQALIDRLMASPAFVRHLANDVDAFLMPGRQGGGLREYLTAAFTANRSWDKVFRELLLADESKPETKGSARFLQGRVNDMDRLTSEVSSLFFGVNVSCAQCHDHPLVPDWKQDHFFGMKSFFQRTFDNGGFLAERDYGTVKFKTTKGQDKQAKLMFLTGKVVDAPDVPEPKGDEQKKEREKLEEFKKKKVAPPAPKWSARAQLVEVALAPEQREFFARAIVNRLWHRLYGHGLVMPLDQMHSENPPSHPELLAWLARDTATHGYDLRRLVRGLVSSRAYARSSRWENGDLPRANLFAVARLRALTPMQLATSLRVATTDPQQFVGPKPEDVAKRLDSIENQARGFAGSIEQPGEDFQIGVGEALLFSNSGRLNEFLGEGGDRLVARMKTAKDPAEQVTLAVRSVLAREPSAEERKALTEYLVARQARPVEASQQLLWALVSSAEFRFNH